MTMENLTIRELKEAVELFTHTKSPIQTIEFGIGKKVIIRTYSAGVWFGELTQKVGDEVVLTNARRMWRWFAVKGISLSEVSKHGIETDKSRIAESVDRVWLQAIDIIPCSGEAIKSIMETPNADR